MAIEYDEDGEVLISDEQKPFDIVLDSWNLGKQTAVYRKQTNNR